jgi:hypothetical protein
MKELPLYEWIIEMDAIYFINTNPEMGLQVSALDGTTRLAQKPAPPPRINPGTTGAPRAAAREQTCQLEGAGRGGAVGWGAGRRPWRAAKLEKRPPCPTNSPP